MAHEIVIPSVMDKLNARKIAAASALTEHWAWFSRRYADSDSPAFHRLRWRVTDAAVVPERWVSFAGDAYAGSRPPLYREAGVMAVRKDMYDAALDLERQKGGRPAVAFALGGVAIAAELPPDLELPVIDDEYVVSGRIGPGPLTMTLAIGYGHGSRLTVPDLRPRIAERIAIESLRPDELLV